MATGKLIGTDTAYSTSALSGYIEMTRFQCISNGNVTEIHLYSNISGNVKVGIYAENGGIPAALLTANNSGTSVMGGQWNIVLIPSIAITAGTYYWLAIITDTTGAHVQGGSGATSIYKSSAYASGLPSPAGSGFTNTTVYFSLAGWGILILSTPSISQPVSCGSPKLNLSIKPSSIVQQLAYGTPEVDISGVVINPQGISVIISLGMPILRYPQTIFPSCTIQPVSIGIPYAGIVGILSPRGISVIVSIGTPTILKYVWHVVLDGQYATETPGVNRAYIIGRNQYGNPVYGTASNTDEIALVGERLDFLPDPAIPTTAQAADVASAVLSRMRLMGKRGVIFIPPNCGQELFDVVEVTDRQANQSAVKFRVVGIRFEYNPGEALYLHKLILGAP